MHLQPRHPHPDFMAPSFPCFKSLIRYKYIQLKSIWNILKKGMFKKRKSFSYNYTHITQRVLLQNRFSAAMYKALQSSCSGVGWESRQHLNESGPTAGSRLQAPLFIGPLIFLHASDSSFPRPWPCLRICLLKSVAVGPTFVVYS